MKKKYETFKTLIEKKLSHDENLILKVMGEIGDLSKMVLDLKTRIDALEKWRKS